MSRAIWAIRGEIPKPVPVITMRQWVALTESMTEHEFRVWRAQLRRKQFGSE